MRKGKKHVRRHKSTKATACSGKQKLFKPQAVALKKALFKKDGAVMQVYRCRHGCKLVDGSVAWHVGHRDRR